MIRTRFKKILLVASAIFPEQLITGYTHIKHITAINNIFPSIYEFNPDLVIFDYDFMGSEMEKVVRRIKVNKFYTKLKICCYKSVPNEKTDSLLKTLGVDYFFYQEDIKTHKQSKNVPSSFSSMFDTSIMKWIPAFRIGQ
ncbi:MAG: hypothetical protein JWQ84_3518 [Mucilaginibacter sp.]|jgi:hypothetical protein|nr:hypothetical protein [Mucilaginibacter sp.]